MNRDQSKAKRSADRQPAYEAPEIKRWGTAVSITKQGNSYEGGDAKSGSVVGTPNEN